MTVPYTWLNPPENPVELALLVLEASKVGTEQGSPLDDAREYLVKIAAVRLASAYLAPPDCPACGLRVRYQTPRS
jgi:hypothetical protein